MNDLVGADLELLVTWILAQAVLLFALAFLSYHRGRHVQSNFDRRVVERAQRRFLMAETLGYGESTTYRIRAFGQSGREMPLPSPPVVVSAVPPEAVVLTLAPDGQHLHVSNRNQAEQEVTVTVSASAGGFSASVNVVCRAEQVAALTLEPAEPPANP